MGLDDRRGGSDAALDRHRSRTSGKPRENSRQLQRLNSIVRDQEVLCFQIGEVGENA